MTTFAIRIYEEGVSDELSLDDVLNLHHEHSPLVHQVQFTDFVTWISDGWVSYSKCSVAMIGCLMNYIHLLDIHSIHSDDKCDMLVVQGHSQSKKQCNLLDMGFLYGSLDIVKLLIRRGIVTTCDDMTIFQRDFICEYMVPLMGKELTFLPVAIVGIVVGFLVGRESK